MRAWMPAIALATTIPLAGALVVACSGSSDKDGEDPDGIDLDPFFDTALDTFEDPVDTDGPVDTDDPPVQPTACDEDAAVGLANVCDLSVNSASAAVSDVDPRPLMMLVQQTAANQPGAYNGSGFGNRAIAGFHQYDGLALSEIDQVSFDARHLSGPLTPTASIGPEIGLQVDLGCDGSDIAYVLVAYEDMPPYVDQGDDLWRFTATKDNAVWTASGGIPYPTPDDTADPDPDPVPEGDLIPDPDLVTAGPPQPLTRITDFYPDACLRNAVLGFDPLPLATETSGVLLTVGDASTLIKVEWEIHRVLIDDDEHLPPQ